MYIKYSTTFGKYFFEQSAFSVITIFLTYLTILGPSPCRLRILGTIVIVCLLASSASFLTASSFASSSVSLDAAEPQSEEVAEW